MHSSGRSVLEICVDRVVTLSTARVVEKREENSREYDRSLCSGVKVHTF